MNPARAQYHCPRCGYELDSPGESICPECGSHVLRAASTARPRPSAFFRAMTALVIIHWALPAGAWIWYALIWNESPAMVATACGVLLPCSLLWLALRHPTDRVMTPAIILVGSEFVIVSILIINLDSWHRSAWLQTGVAPPLMVGVLLVLTCWLVSAYRYRRDPAEDPGKIADPEQTT